MSENKEHVLLIGGVYRHFKGGYYVVWGFAENAETGENTVLYHGENDAFMGNQVIHIKERRVEAVQDVASSNN